MPASQFEIEFVGVIHRATKAAFSLKPRNETCIQTRSSNIWIDYKDGAKHEFIGLSLYHIQSITHTVIIIKDRQL